MPPETVISNANTERLRTLITSARNKLVFVSPGVTGELADAIVAAWERVGRDAVVV